MGANESNRRAENQDENRENEGGGSVGKNVAAVAVAAGAAAVLVGGAMALFSSKSQDREEMEERTEQFSSNPHGSSSMSINTVPKQEKLVISWEKPEIGWVKVNTDGSVKGAADHSLAEATAGGLIRNSNGQWIKGFRCNIGYGNTPVLAELTGVMKGLELAWNIGRRKIIVETDNEGVLQMIKDTRNRQNDNYKLAKEIKELLGRDWEAEVELKLCRRESNRCADWLANYGREIEVGRYEELPHPPESLRLRTLLNQDS
ncbi:hypothetical protein OROHE_024245 [Orobanche hederae]